MRNGLGQFAHGSKHLVTHGKARTKVYGIWSSMKSRCENPNNTAYPRYGGRGIAVCERWQSFANFYSDMGDPPPGMSLDRENNDGGYNPDNCRWASRVTQARNKRGLHLLTIEGVERPLCEWAEISGIKLATLWARLNKGWPPEKAIDTPIRISNRWHGARHGVEWSEPETQRRAA